jgi:chromosome segregation ATPase
LQLKATAEEEVRTLRTRAAHSAAAVQSLEARLQTLAASADGSERAAAATAEQAERHAADTASLLKAKHAVEMRVLALEAQARETTAQLYRQRVAHSDGPPWWQRKIESLEAERAALSKADAEKATEVRRKTRKGGGRGGKKPRN